MPENGFSALQNDRRRTVLDRDWTGTNRRVSSIDSAIDSTDPARAATQTTPRPLSPPAPETLPPEIRQRAWFTLAHLLPAPGARIADLGCGGGEIAHAIAASTPDVRIVGVDSNRHGIDRAKSLPPLPNLEFRRGNIMHPPFEDESLDAIVNAFTLHEIYSESRHSEQVVRNALKMHLSLLRPGGLMFVQDYLCPSHEGFVLLEIDNPPGQFPSVAENLVWYAEHAHPAQDPASGGFYLEERPPRFPRTRLFRLPFKWALEFILRPHDREGLAATVHHEYTCFTKSDFRKEMRNLGARILYSAPHTNEILLRRQMAHCRLYAENGTPLPPPTTSFIAVLRKTGEGESTLIQERRPSKISAGGIRITALRDEKDGRIVDVATPDRAVVEILPWRLNERGAPVVFVHDGVSRGVVNAIPRLGANLDDREWSGHMIEAISVDESAVRDAENGGVKDILNLCLNRLGLRPEIGQVLEPGPDFYPAPDFIDARICTRYLRVADQGAREFPAPDALCEPGTGAAERGRIREIDAQLLLDAVSVGYIPNARLEIQLLRLFDRLGIKPKSWATCPLILNRIENLPLANLDEIERTTKPRRERTNRFKAVKGTAGQLRVVHSIFVEEGLTRGGITGLAAHDRDFVLPDDTTDSIAVVLPLSVDASGEIMAGIVMKYLPIPERYTGNGAIVSAPSFLLPPEVKTLYQARKFIADQFDVGIENVSKMGESYFCHYGVTPRRIYPFALSVPIPSKYKVGYFNHGPIKMVQFAPLRGLMYMIWKSLGETPLMKMFAQTYQAFGFDNEAIRVETSFGASLIDAKTTAVSTSSMEFIADRTAPPPKRTPRILAKGPEEPEPAGPWSNGAGNKAAGGSKGDSAGDSGSANGSAKGDAPSLPPVAAQQTAVKPPGKTASVPDPEDVEAFEDPSALEESIPEESAFGKNGNTPPPPGPGFRE